MPDRRAQRSASRSDLLNCIAGISEPRLIASGFWIQRRRFSGVFSAAPPPIVVRLIRCVKSGPEAAVRHSAVNCVTVNADRGFEYPFAGANTFVVNCRLLLLAHPLSKVVRSIDRHAQEHLGVLGPAVLRALTEEDSCVLDRQSV